MVRVGACARTPSASVLKPFSPMRLFTMYRTRLFLLTTIVAVVIACFVAMINAHTSIPFPEGIPGQIVNEADAEKLVLSAPDSIEVGELVRLSIAGSDVTGPKWEIDPYTDDFAVYNEGFDAHLSARPDAPEVFTLMVSGAKDGQSYLVYRKIHVQGLEVEVGPRTLAHEVEGWGKLITKYDGRDKHLRDIARVYREVAADPEVSVEEMLGATAIASTAVLGQELIAEKGAWAPFLDKLGDKLDEYGEQPGWGSREDYNTVWLLVARGLERAAK